MMKYHLARLCSSALLLLVFAKAQAHPFAVTTTEVEYNSKSRCFEVAMRLYPEQLEQALSKESGKPISFERTAEIDLLIVRYLSSQFSIERSDRSAKAKDEKRPSTIRWIGKELTPKSAWLYFEVPFDGSLSGIKVKNSMFFQLNPEQLNTIHFAAYDRVASCSLTPRDPQSVVHWHAKERGKPETIDRSLEF